MAPPGELRVNAGVVLLAGDPHLSALEVRFSRRCAIQIDVYLYLYQPATCNNARLMRIQYFVERHLSTELRPLVINGVIIGVSVDVIRLVQML